MEASVIRSEIRSNAELKSRFAFVSASSRHEIRRADQLVQVDCAPVVDSDIEACSSDNLAIQDVSLEA